MIYYRPLDGDAHCSRIHLKPRTCFIMTKLGNPIPYEVHKIRDQLGIILHGRDIFLIDANSIVTGRDFLMKIWRLIVEVPMGIAIIHEGMPQPTLSNVFYEVGMMQAYGKETLVVKTAKAEVPSDLVRTEYVEYNDDFDDKVEKFIDSVFEIADHFEMMADDLENNPLLSIDYLRRAYLITRNPGLQQKAKLIFNEAGLADRARSSAEMLLMQFSDSQPSKNRYSRN